ncbi:hypothetical protein [Pseudomonas fluorescens]|uniref:hypothetical protein n=1 Tax=Pseudomonas fluorescens TaxID=294 RepID=UPI00177E5971|nr:hypothetical protein [Pseudomonas fluorescens]
MPRNDLPATCFTNALTSPLVAELSQPPFADEQLSTFSPQALALINERECYDQNHPVTAIYRMATQGSQSRDGGTIRQASSPLEITLQDGSVACVALVGDVVEYPDGSQAQIVSGAGQHANWNDRGFALVGRVLSNGDEIINTPQDSMLLTQLAGVPMSDDFLTVVG